MSQTSARSARLARETALCCMPHRCCISRLVYFGCLRAGPWPCASAALSSTAESRRAYQSRPDRSRPRRDALKHWPCIGADRAYFEGRRGLSMGSRGLRVPAGLAGSRVKVGVALWSGRKRHHLHSQGQAGSRARYDEPACGRGGSSLVVHPGLGRREGRDPRLRCCAGRRSHPMGRLPAVSYGV